MCFVAEVRKFVWQEGDAILLPHGTNHQMLDSPSTIPEPGQEVMMRLMNEVDTEAAPEFDANALAGISTGTRRLIMRFSRNCRTSSFCETC